MTRKIHPPAALLETGNPDVVEEALDSAENVGVITLEWSMTAASAKTLRKGIGIHWKEKSN